MSTAGANGERMQALYRKYLEEIQKLDDVPVKSYDAFAAVASGALIEMESACLYDGDALQGVLYYTCGEENGVLHVFVPVFGYYADCEKTLVRLFQKLAEQLVTNKKPNFPCISTRTIFRASTRST